MSATPASWVDGAEAGSDFPIENLPLGIFSTPGEQRRPGVAIGDYVLDLPAIADLLDEEWRDDLSQPVLNGWLSRGRADQRALRERLTELLSDERYRADVEDASDRAIGSRDAPAVPDRRLHRFLRRHPSRDQRRQAVPPRQSAAAQL